MDDLSKDIERELTVKAKVEAILKEDPESRNSDRRLILKYLERYCCVKLPPEAEQAMLKLPSKSIINWRQRIQNIERKYRPTNRKVRDRRRDMSEAVRITHANA